MRAGILRAPDMLALENVADPLLSPGDMLLRVKAAAICGTDIRIFRGRKTLGVHYPIILGHEFSGELVDNGGNDDFSCGEALAVAPAIPCGHCAHCKRGLEHICQNLIAVGYEIDGAFADYIRIPKKAVEMGNIYRIPQGMAFEAAALAEPLACVLNGQERLGIEVGDTVVILGAGPIGIFHIKLARLRGAEKIIVSQTSAPRRQAALAAGADIVVDPRAENLAQIVRAHTGGLGADAVIVAIGVPHLANDALTLARHRGKINLFAGFSRDDTATLDVNLIHYHELIVTGSFGLSRLHFEKALAMIASGAIEVDSMLTHHFDLSEIGAALATAEQGQAIKVAVTNA